MDVKPQLTHSLLAIPMYNQANFNPFNHKLSGPSLSAGPTERTASSLKITPYTSSSTGLPKSGIVRLNTEKAVVG